MDYSHEEDGYEEEFEENDSNMNLEKDENYEPYDYTNTVQKIFKTEKIKRNLSENDPRRFEDADI